MKDGGVLDVLPVLPDGEPLPLHLGLTSAGQMPHLMGLLHGLPGLATSATHLGPVATMPCLPKGEKCGSWRWPQSKTSSMWKNMLGKFAIDKTKLDP